MESGCAIEREDGCKDKPKKGEGDVVIRCTGVQK